MPACSAPAIGKCVDDAFKRRFGNKYPDTTPLANIIAGGPDPAIDLMMMLNESGCTKAVSSNTLQYKITTVGDLKEFLLGYCEGTLSP